jgi:sigma-B regulation protein RsbU (phosphoserine phosphatase)
MIQRRLLTGLPGPGLVSAASRWCQELGADLALGHDDLYRVEVCLEELTTNLAKYGGVDCADLPVHLSLEIDEEQLRLDVVDRCAPFDPVAFEPTLLPATLSEVHVGGRGLQLLQAVSDDRRYEYRDGCNRLTLTFELEQPPRVPEPAQGLAGVAAFRGVSPAALDEALGVLTLQDLADDVTLLVRGQVNHSVLFVLEGSVHVFLDRPEGDDFIEVGAGECLGEMSVIDDLPVSAHVRGCGGARLLVVDGDTFVDRVLTVPGVARNIISAQAARTRRNDQVTIERTRQLMAMEQARREMDFARSIQASLLPAEPLFPDDDRLDCAGRMRPARDVGGDFYDVFLLDERHLLFVVADVCGKGLPAALFMVRAIAALRAQPRAQSPSEDHLAELVADLNTELCERNTAHQYLTAFVGLLDLSTRRLRYLDAGHPPTLLAVGRARFDLLEEPVNPPVGMVPGLSYRTGEVQLEPGSRLLLYSDGVTEAEDDAGRMFGEERLLEHCRSLPVGSAGDLVEAVVGAVESFVDGAQQSDDITVLAIACPDHGAPGGPGPE